MRDIESSIARYLEAMETRIARSLPSRRPEQIVAHVVSNNGIDRDQLTSMAKLARTEMGIDKLTAVANRGYYKSEEIRTSIGARQASGSFGDSRPSSTA
ncbi:hypothetical protein M3I56_20200 [Paraburkholderia sp. CNPSo 3281]|nr:hypothetical protein [Paraburkholderia sp. CNPSo 3281]MCP3717678.1 hypothetical protein [Paraburkholderia sp. CNPSo 3281]